ncbi:MAG: hypothetical protein Q4G09_05095 [Clostridia bacterium]|nr:hypothetical protein [Clostridia bacterium]
MNKIIRFYNQNRVIFWIIVFVIIGIIVIVQSLNKKYKNIRMQNSSDIRNNITTSATYNTVTKPTISGDTIKEQTSTQTTKIIDDFMTFCNNKQIEQAYNLLSEDCRQELYPDIQAFTDYYYNNIFSEYRRYNIEAWITTTNVLTYKITIMQDILATGSISKLNIQDYYTIVIENNDYKLNINNYIGKEEVNVQKNIKNVNFQIINKYVYMDYVIYNIKVHNNTDKKIMVDSKENTRTVNIIDQNKLKYVSFLNEISENDLTVLSGMTKEIRIKFNKSYNPKYIDKNIEFTDIILDLNNKQNKNSITINL